MVTVNAKGSNVGSWLIRAQKSNDGPAISISLLEFKLRKRLSPAGLCEQPNQLSQAVHVDNIVLAGECDEHTTFNEVGLDEEYRSRLD
jgi:hypothetical protein